MNRCNYPLVASWHYWAPRLLWVIEYLSGLLSKVDYGKVPLILAERLAQPPARLECVWCEAVMLMPVGYGVLLGGFYCPVQGDGLNDVMIALEYGRNHVQ